MCSSLKDLQFDEKLVMNVSKLPYWLNYDFKNLDRFQQNVLLGHFEDVFSCYDFKAEKKGWLGARVSFVAESPENDSPKIKLSKRLLLEASRLSASGDHRGACDLMLPDLSRGDIPIRDQDWFLRNRCLPPNENPECEAFSLEDWKYRNCGGQPSENFLKNCFRVIESSCAALNLNGAMPECILTKAMKKRAFRDVVCNPYVIYATRLSDAELCPFQGNEEFFRQLYLVRNRIGQYKDFGYKVLLNNFQAEGSSQSFFELPERLQAETNNISDWSFSALYERATNFVWSIFESILKLITDVYESILQRLRNFLKRLLKDLFHLEELSQTLNSTEFRTKMFSFFCIALLVFFVGTHIVTRNIVEQIVRSTLRNLDRTPFVAEQELTGPALATMVVVGVFGLTKSSEEKIISKVRYMTALVAGGTIVSNVGAYAFSLLPELMRDAVLYKFGSKFEIMRHEVNSWRSTSNALLHLSTIPKVVISSEFIKRVREQMSTGSEMLNKLSSPKYSQLRSQVILTFGRLQKIHINITQHKEVARTRDEPFLVHVFGMPGIGKSTLHKQLLLKAFGITAAETFPWSFTATHPSGYVNQRAVTMDEFLVADHDTNAKAVQDFLRMKSSERFKLDMPSLDDPFTGVKGAEFSSEVMVTMNNHRDFKVTGYDAGALNRRRDVVVEFFPSEKCQKYVKTVNNRKVFDTNLVPQEFIRDMSWINARIWPSIPNPQAAKSPPVTFNVVCEHLSEKFREKRKFSKMLRELNECAIDDERDPESLINEELRKVCSMPARPVSIMEAMMKLMGQDFVAEAPTPRPKHRHTCSCGTTTRHRVDDKPFVCPCGKAQRCSSEGGDQETDRVNLVTTTCTDDTHFHECIRKECSNKIACRGGSPGSKVCHQCVVKTGISDEKVHETLRAMQKSRDDRDYTFQAASPLFDDLETWQEAMAELVLEDITTFWDVLHESYIRETQEPMKHTLARWLLSGAAVGVIVAVAKWLGNTDPNQECLTFEPESDPRRKIRHKTNKTRSWSRGRVDYESEGKRAVAVSQLDVGHCVMNVIPIAERWVLTYAHGLFDKGLFLPDKHLIFYHNKHSYEWDVSPSDIIMSKDENGSVDFDVAFIKIGDKRCPEFKNVISNFASDSDIPEGKFRVNIRTERGLNMTFANIETAREYAYGDTKFDLHDGFSYHALTNHGDCGSPLFLASTKNVGQCIGIHVAGSISKVDPIGLSVRVSKEMLLEALGPELAKYSAEGSLLDELVLEERPNLKSIEEVPEQSRVHLCTKSKLRPSAISGFVPYKTVKEPAIMSVDDPRSKGKDPVDLAITRLVSAPKVNIDDNILKLCEDDLVEFLSSKLDYSGTGGLRFLTFEESIFGIPGVLSSIATDTHPGSPYCYFTDKKGKRELVYYEKGNGYYDPNFKEHVLEVFDMVCNGEDLGKVFVGFLKDETRSKSKIEAVNTRITYSNDVTYNVVCRMLFGSMVAAFNSSFPHHNYALGINPSSFDAGKIYSKFIRFKDRLVAGDFKEFDLRHQRQIMDASFSVLSRLGAKLSFSKTIFEHVRKHETEAPLQIGRWLLKTICNNASGGFWTTILNCITCEIYFRYIFKKAYPSLIFEDHISLTILGDDHILGNSEEVDLNPCKVRDLVAELGQIYTSAVKDEELTPDFKTFDEILFLGNYFRRVAGHWTGALRKETLEESILWTRNDNKTLVSECRQMVEYASQWDYAYYSQFLKKINEGLEKCGLEKLSLPPFSSLRVTVANRTTDNTGDFMFVAQSTIEREAEGVSIETPGLTTVDTTTRVNGEDTALSSKIPLDLSVSDADASIGVGTSSFVKRAQFEWTQADTETIAQMSSINVPFNLLGMGDQSNIQNMGFQHYLFSQPDIEVMIQLNGSPTQVGCLMVVFVPLGVQDPQYAVAPSMIHVKLNPCDNQTGILRIPFRYWRSALDNQRGHDEGERLGRLIFYPWSPLVTKTANTTCGVTIFSKFITRQRVPRSLPVSKTNNRPNYGFTRGTGSLAGQLLSSDETWVAEGGNVSTTNVSNTYSISDVAGNIPIENTSRTGDSKQSLDQKAQMDIPLDNPPVVGGGIPVVNQFSSMSKTVGPEPTIGLGLHPQELSRQPMVLRDNEESLISSLLARKGRLTNFEWNTQQSDGTDLFSISLNSALSGDALGWGAQTDSPVNLFILNMFKFVRFDVKFSVHVVRSKFHSGRLLASVDYATLGSTPIHKNAFYNNVLDFNGENSVCEFVVPWNSTQEYIRTFENLTEDTSSHSIGRVWFSVLNELRVTSEVVPESVDVIIEVSFLNVKVAHPNSYSAFEAGPYSRVKFVAQGGADETQDVNETDTVIETTQQRRQFLPGICRLNLGSKFEHNVQDIHEVVRRYNLLDPVFIGKTSVTSERLHSSENRDVHGIPCRPMSEFNHIFAAWSGSLKFRIFADTPKHCNIMLSLGSTGSNNVDYGHFLSVHGGRMPLGTATNVNTPVYGPYAPREVMYPIGEQSFIDVSVPFISELNVVPTWRNNVTPGTGFDSRSIGTIFVNVPEGVNIHVYWAAGDDFRYSVYSPTRGFRFSTSEVLSGAPPTGINHIAGMRFPQS